MGRARLRALSLLNEDLTGDGSEESCTVMYES